MLRNNKGEIVAGILVGIVIGMFVTFIGHLNDKENPGIRSHEDVRNEQVK